MHDFGAVIMAADETTNTTSMARSNSLEMNSGNLPRGQFEIVVERILIAIRADRPPSKQREANTLRGLRDLRVFL